MFQKRHYEEIARVLRDTVTTSLDQEIYRQALIEALCSVLARDNPNFHPARFTVACLPLETGAAPDETDVAIEHEPPAIDPDVADIRPTPLARVRPPLPPSQAPAAPAAPGPDVDTSCWPFTDRRE